MMSLRPCKKNSCAVSMYFPPKRLALAGMQAHSGRWAFQRLESRAAPRPVLGKPPCFRYIPCLSPSDSNEQGFYGCFSGSAERWPQNVAVEVQHEAVQHDAVQREP